LPNRTYTVRFENITEVKDDPREVVFLYHERSKHDYQRFAPSLGYLDWSSQPASFRSFKNAERISLPVPVEDQTPPWPEVFSKQKSDKELTSDTLSDFLYYSAAVSAWREYGGTYWALRVNPSSGNLHPTEFYLLLPPLSGWSSQAGVFHYCPKDHSLEKRAGLDQKMWDQLTGSLPEGSFLLATSSVHWSEAWKYGERAYRYCQQDLGHALGALRIAAAMQGWSMRLIDRISDDALAALTGINRVEDFPLREPETPGFLIVIYPEDEQLQEEWTPAAESIEGISQGQWFGKADQLSPAHHNWKMIEVISDACKKENDRPEPEAGQGLAPCGKDRAPGWMVHPEGVSSGHIVRSRRSAQQVDPGGTLSREAFLTILGRLVPKLNRIPWDCRDWPAVVHVALFVHSVEGLDSGLYLLLRDETREDILRGCLDIGFTWERPPDIPSGLPLYLLGRGNLRNRISNFCCRQEIAGQGVFACAMLAEFEGPILVHGAHWYRRLFWEAGMIGQMLYLEAEAQGMRGTGIGCYFDDPTHWLFGISGRTIQSLYHFTAGVPVADPRAAILPAYPPPLE
jgi:SagB-type dehydrogenase family enzyme